MKAVHLWEAATGGTFLATLSLSAGLHDVAAILGSLATICAAVAAITARRRCATCRRESEQLAMRLPQGPKR